MIETKTKRTEISIETHCRTVIKTRGTIETTFCNTCGRKVPIVTSADAALIFSERSECFDAANDSAQIHAVAENAVCAISLADHFTKRSALPGIKNEGEE